MSIKLHNIIIFTKVYYNNDNMAMTDIVVVVYECMVDTIFIINGMYQWNDKVMID